ncbi:tyrosine-type recombinase/integrase [Actibacterium sp. XHP0104]|uniref:tyrosine-type recombinase/integrase n=1 Tax=Actibacterium sp. XHP0104 TaxID=2984335 RepID=UPI0021E86A0B|nr:integrase arm-type DNA-binding domain-containing protein [Actibacterium sp. XHP0104]MCV2881696.1 integrase arm-type DNA-binding domain-containing protein [Actibacterium sp. XHP0104]
MRAKNLTTKGVDALPAAPEGKRTDHPDLQAPGLFLRVNDWGRKTWMCHFRVKGKQGKVALGQHPALGLAEAREKAREVRELAERGVHPKAAREQAVVRAEATSLEVIGEDFIAAMEAEQLTGGRRRPVTPETARGRASLLRRLVFPALGHRPVGEVTQAEVAALLARIDRQGGPVDRTLQTIRLLFKFAASRGLFAGTPPTVGLTPRQAPQKEGRDLNDAELRAMWLAADEWGFPYGHAVKLLMLTGQRRDEIGDARWADVDLDRALLVVPEVRAKNRAGVHEVPLSDPALAVLREAALVESVTGHVFPNAAGTGPVNGWSKSGKNMIRNARAALAGLTPEDRAFLHSVRAQGPDARARKVELNERIEAVPGWRFHDLRHTFITRLRAGEENDAGETTFAVALDVVQACVNHQLTAGITDVYDHSDVQRRYRLRKREAMDWWGRMLMGIVRPAVPESGQQAVG